MTEYRVWWSDPWPDSGDPRIYSHLALVPTKLENRAKIFVRLLNKDEAERVATALVVDMMVSAWVQEIE